ncbi:MAG TPA: sialate O-acetylesterase [Opitutaceae bacterium]|nr:sialate O-acetylesterase [Opitutaceae bacterium]
MKSFSLLGLAGALALCPVVARADVKLASPFTDHMVLQRELPVPVWGWADPGETVTVEFAGQKKTATAGADGQWRVTLDPLTASAESRDFVVSGTNRESKIENQKLSDVLVGEVWLGSGQSNMEFVVSKKVKYFSGVVNEEQEIAAADHPLVRMFTAAGTKTFAPQKTVAGEWLVCSPETVPGFSAVGYFFARDLQQRLGVPVGFITVAYGASCAQAWIRREAMLDDPAFKAVLDRFDEAVKSFTPPTPEEEAQRKDAAAKAKAAGQRAPRGRANPVQDQHNPTVCFNGMVAPVIPYAIRGVLWYQGESITAPRELFPRWNELLVSDWRKLWGRELPFYFVQLAALDNNSNSPQVREWQAEALRIPDTAMAVTIDIGDKKDVHPHNKAPLGDRLTLIALARDYGRKLEYSGPLCQSASVDRGAIRVKFSHAGGGLVAKDGALKTFEVAGADGKFVPAEATIEGDTLLVRAADVGAPVVARYAWANYPEGANLYNAAGLPAAPFRTDHPLFEAQHAQ